MAEAVDQKEYNAENDRDRRVENEDDRDENRDKRMSAGQSRRIWDELHKVLDSSDVIVQVLDARDPEGTRSRAIEDFIKRNCPHKHIVLLINKSDLVPVWVLAKWVKAYSKEYPTIAFRSSISKPFGKGSLINLFRQFDIFHRDKKNISIGFVGYPNVGKSSVINAMKERRVCKAAPVPGETKVWQYITLTKRIYLIDCPGTVHVNEGKDDVDSVLKGCVRAEKIDVPTYYISFIIDKINNKAFLNKFYGVKDWVDAEDFIRKVAIKKGKLRKGGEPDLEATSKLILIDWQRGELPYYTLPEGEVDVKYEQAALKDRNITIDQVKEEAFLQEVGGQPMIIDEELAEGLDLEEGNE